MGTSGGGKATLHRTRGCHVSKLRPRMGRHNRQDSTANGQCWQMREMSARRANFAKQSKNTMCSTPVRNSKFVQLAATVEAVQPYVLSIPCSMPVQVRGTYNAVRCQMNVQPAGSLQRNVNT